MMLLSKKMLNDRHRPGPLPRGEGELFAVSRNNLRLVLLNDFRHKADRTIAAPSPGGEGRGDGGRNH
jgi:hypothetical protein